MSLYSEYGPDNHRHDADLYERGEARWHGYDYDEFESCVECGAYSPDAEVCERCAPVEEEEEDDGE